MAIITGTMPQPCLNTISCATPSPPRRSSRWSPGTVGYFLVLRGQTFAGHALAHVGFTGATGAVLVGIAPLWGMVADDGGSPASAWA